MMGVGNIDHLDPLTPFHTALQAARRRHSDLYIARSGYRIAAVARLGSLPLPGAHGAALRAWFRPSAVLEILSEAEAAHRHCRRVLPAQWCAGLKVDKEQALLARPWVEEQLARGDAVPQLSFDAFLEDAQEVVRALDTPEPQDRVLHCAKCGRRAPAEVRGMQSGRLLQVRA